MNGFWSEYVSGTRRRKRTHRDCVRCRIRVTCFRRLFWFEADVSQQKWEVAVERGHLSAFRRPKKNTWLGILRCKTSFILQTVKPAAVFSCHRQRYVVEKYRHILCQHFVVTSLIGLLVRYTRLNSLWPSYIRKPSDSMNWKLMR